MNWGRRNAGFRGAGLTPAASVAPGSVVQGRRGLTRALAVGAVVALAAGCSGGGGGDASGLKGDGSSYVKGDGAVTVVPEAKREEPIELSADTLGGDTLNIATLRGK